MRGYFTMCINISAWRINNGLLLILCVAYVRINGVWRTMAISLLLMAYVVPSVAINVCNIGVDCIIVMTYY